MKNTICHCTLYFARNVGACKCIVNLNKSLSISEKATHGRPAYSKANHVLYYIDGYVLSSGFVVLY